ncbi:MAG: PAS domain S-box protein [Candidatus Eisenbacteria sp.]|nr:PAS domain S-box protein [Candidatus Eisenbacteria bacterium]
MSDRPGRQAAIPDNARHAVSDPPGLEAEGTVPADPISEATFTAGMRAAFLRSPQPILCLDLQGRVTHWNPAAESLFGWSEAEVVGKPNPTVPEEFLAEFRTNMEVLLADEVCDRLPVTCLKKDGTLVEAILTAAPISGEEGKVRGFVGIITDLTDLIRVQEDLLAGEARYRHLVEFMAAGVAVYEAVDDGDDFVFKEFNRAGEQIEGVHRDAVIGRRLREAFPGVEDFGLLDVMRRVWRTGQPEHFPIRHYQDDRISGWRDNYVYKLPSGEIVAVYEDVTERRRLQDQLHQAQKMEAIGTLAGGIAHDFNNILYAIKGYTQLAVDEVPGPSETHRSLTEVIKATDRGAELVRRLLSFGRREEETRRPLRLQETIVEIRPLLRGMLPTTIEIRQAIDEACGPVLADPVQIGQILMNLATNASQAMREKGGTLEIRLDAVQIPPADPGTTADLPPGAYARLSVRDSGVGMDGDTRGRIFDPYFTTRRGGDGTGLGLSTVGGIVRSHRGAIEVTSAPGEGALFEIFLPICKPLAGAKSSDETDERIPRGNERILVVDDEEMIVDFVRRALERLGYEVLAFTDSTAALRAFRADPQLCDLVITDQTMPGTPGDALAKEMLAIRRDLPIILTTGYNDRIDDARAQALGIRAFRAKPVAFADLARTLRALLDV